MAVAKKTGATREAKNPVVRDARAELKQLKADFEAKARILQRQILQEKLKELD